MPKLKVINLGAVNFSSAIQEAGVDVTHINWKPPAHGDEELVKILFRMMIDFRDEHGCSRIDRANTEALKRILAAKPVLQRVRPAHLCLPDFTPHSLLHAGPPIHWRDMCGPMRGSILGALKYEGLAHSDEEALDLMNKGEITYGPTHPYRVVAPMTGVVSYSMPLLEVKNETFGNSVYSPLNEGPGNVLRFGAHNRSVIKHLSWLQNVLAPVLDKAVQKIGGVNLKGIMAQALAMGDELHQRNTAASLLFYRSICKEIAEAAPNRNSEMEILEFLVRNNQQFFLNMAMAASRSAMDPACNIPFCSVITCMSRNGVQFGIQVSSLGDNWFTAPSDTPTALYFPGFDENDANPDIGDSAIVECYGLGGFAVGTAPTVARFSGASTLDDAIQFTKNMAQICIGTNPDLPLPNLDFKGTPVGIDIRRVVATDILPSVNSGVAHRQSGIGQVGAGHTNPPMKAINMALRAFYGHMLANS